MARLLPNQTSDYLAPEYGITIPANSDFPREGLAARPQPVRPRRGRKIAKWFALIVVGAVFAVGAWLSYKFIVNTLKATKGNLLGLITDTKLKGESTGRVNVLLAGNSSDDPGHGGGDLTDSLMIVSLDTKGHTAYVMSIPRDTWVNTPGYGHQKINAVYPEGGMSLLAQVVSNDFGVNLNYYSLVDYTAFKQAVDAVGGITVNIQSSDSRGIYDPNIAVDTHGPALRLKNGVQTLDGATALNLARARNDPTPSGATGYGLPNGDFDRAANQRLMLAALKDKAASISTLANPVKISQLLDALGNNVKTNFSAGDLRRLLEITKNIPSSAITSVSLQDSAKNVNLLANYTSADGQAALIPAAGLDDFGDIQRFVTRLNSADPVVKENAAVVVLNGSSTTGLAKTEASKLKALNVNVISYATASKAVAVTQIVMGSSALPATVSLLKKTYGVTVITTNATLMNQYPDADIIVIVGPSQ